MIEHIIRNNLVSFDCQCSNRHVKQAYFEWTKHVNKSHFKIEAAEVQVFSEIYGYAGTMDAVATRRNPDGSRSLVALDWKTSNMIHMEYAWQVAAYAKALEEMTGEKVTSALVVRFEKEAPVYEVRKVKDIDAAFKAFLACLSIYKAITQQSFFAP
jgi:hypothetical protein